MQKEQAFETLQYISDIVMKMSGATVGEVRRLDKAIVFLDQYIKLCEAPKPPEAPKPTPIFNGKKGKVPFQQSGAV